MDQRRAIDEDRIALLEQLVRETSDAATDFERKYDEVRVENVHELGN